VSAYLQAGLEALGDATRMAIFQRLSSGPMAVGELAETLPVSRPAVSQHLKVLREAGLVLDAKDGTRRLYRLDPEGVARLRAHFDLVWEQAMSRFHAAVVAKDGRERAGVTQGKPKERARKKAQKEER
jgi:DNA-binding transcriptional ArsR family regulator